MASWARSRSDRRLGLVPESWVIEELGDSHAVQTGGTRPEATRGTGRAAPFPWVKTAEVSYSTITETAEHITSAALQETNVKLFAAGTLLLAMYGQGVTRGKVGKLGIEATCNQACAAIQCPDGEVNPDYLYYFLEWQYESIRARAHGGQQQNLSLDIVRKIPIAYPHDLDQQQEIAALLRAIDQKVELHQARLDRLGELYQRILLDVMTGEVPVEDSGASGSGIGGERRMTTLKIAEGYTVQFPMVKHVAEVGWTVMTPEEAEAKRHGRANMLFRDDLEAKLLEFNAWLTDDQARAIVDTIEAMPATIEGNRDVLGLDPWRASVVRRGGEASPSRSGRSTSTIPVATTCVVTWEWKIEPLARKGNRADVMFVINGLPVAIVEHKNPKDGGALDRAVKQLRRYEKETPELLGGTAAVQRHAPAGLLVRRHLERQPALHQQVEADAGRGVPLRGSGVLRADGVPAHAPALDPLLRRGRRDAEVRAARAPAPRDRQDRRPLRRPGEEPRPDLAHPGFGQDLHAADRRAPDP